MHLLPTLCFLSESILLNLLFTSSLQHLYSSPSAAPAFSPHQRLHSCLLPFFDQRSSRNTLPPPLLHVHSIDAWDCWWVGQYPGEKEITFSPFTCLEADGVPRVERNAKGEVVIFPLKVPHHHL